MGDSCACLDPVNKDCALYLRYNNVLLVLLDEVRASIVTGEKRVKSDVGERESRKEEKNRRVARRLLEPATCTI